MFQRDIPRKNHQVIKDLRDKIVIAIAAITLSKGLQGHRLNIVSWIARSVSLSASVGGEVYRIITTVIITYITVAFIENTMWYVCISISQLNIIAIQQQKGTACQKTFARNSEETFIIKILDCRFGLNSTVLIPEVKDMYLRFKLVIPPFSTNDFVSARYCSPNSVQRCAALDTLSLRLN